MSDTSLPANEKARNAHGYNLAAFVASLAMSATIAASSTVVFFILCACERFHIILQPRIYSHLNLATQPLVANPIDTLRLIVRSSCRTISHDCGVDGLLFDRYLRFLVALFGSSAAVFTPTLAVFNYVVSSQDDDLDFLARLSWTSLTPNDSRYYWLYVSFVPVFAGFYFWMITWELKQAIVLRQRLMQTRSLSEGEASPCFYVAVSNLPLHLQSDQELRGLCAHWEHQIALISMLGAQNKAKALVERLEELVRHIERRETAFIHQIVRLQKKGISNVRLADRLEQRHSKKSRGGWLHNWLRDALLEWMPYRAQPIDWLYFALLKLVRSRQDLIANISQERKSAAVIGLRDHRDARSLARHLPSGDAASIRAQYLGPNLHQIIPSSIPQSRIAAQARSGLVNIVTVVLIVLWTIPVGANGFVSQISSAFRLLHRAEDWHIPAWLTGLVQGVLPQLMTGLVMNLMLIILRFLMNNKGHLTSTDVQLSIQQFYFWFLFAQLFITTSISSGLIPALAKIIDGGAAQLPQILARNLPLAGNYYLSYLVLHTGTQSLSILARIPAIIKLYTSVDRSHTPKDQIDALYGLHQVVHWGEIYPVYTTIGVIVIIYSLLMPLILPIASLTCTVLRFCFRYAFLYTANINVDTSGRLYFRAILNLYWGVITMEFALLGLFLLKVDPRNLRNDLSQISVLILTILGTIQYQHSIQCFYQPLIGDYEAVSHQDTPRLSDTTEVHLQSEVSEKYRPAISKGQDSHSLAALDLNIWLPKDVGGVSDGLVESIRRNYIGPSAQIRLTNSGAAMDSDGHVILDYSTAHSILSAPKVP